MRLHLDRTAFTALLRLVAATSGIRMDVLEKDYYVTIMLKELADQQDTLPAYFKGGTALYKALNSIRRFSEDIDLTVCIDGCSNSQAKRRLEKAANGYKSLPRTAVKEMESNMKGSITSVYDYESVTGGITVDPLQRFSHVKAEATSFTVSEPFTALTISPLIYDKAEKDQQTILRDQYGVAPFAINTIRLERIFADKIFASEFYYQRGDYFDVSKHIYDIAVMSELEIIRRLLAAPDDFAAMLDYKRREERVRIGSDLADKPFSAFTVFEGMRGNRKLIETYATMQDIYIFDPADKIDYGPVCEAAVGIRDVLCALQ